uniref:Uncharacterized protein n=1 Tax=Micrurus lemniscatus lemniscatus TaxID=129467 RepID=A0A2D4I3M0_MICLE
MLSCNWLSPILLGLTPSPQKAAACNLLQHVAHFLRYPLQEPAIREEKKNRTGLPGAIQYKRSTVIFFSLYKQPPQIITVILDNGSDPVQEFCMSHFLGRHSLSRKLVQFNFQMVPSIQVKMHKYKSPSNTS